MTVTTPPRRPEIEPDRDLEQRVADLEALIEEARRRARRRRQRNGAARSRCLPRLGLPRSSASAARRRRRRRVRRSPDGSGAESQATTTGSVARGTSRRRPGPRASRSTRAGRTSSTSRAHTRAAASTSTRRPTAGGTGSSTGAQGAGWMSDILSLTADPRHPGHAVRGHGHGRLQDSGWRPHLAALQSGALPAAGRPARLLTSRRMWRSRHCVKLPSGTPGTTSWNRNNGWVLDVAVDPVHSNVVYSAAGAVRKSTDGGHTWKTVLLPYANAWDVASRESRSPRPGPSRSTRSRTTNDTGRHRDLQVDRHRQDLAGDRWRCLEPSPILLLGQQGRTRSRPAESTDALRSCRRHRLRDDRRWRDLAVDDQRSPNESRHLARG